MPCLSRLKLTGVGDQLDSLIDEILEITEAKRYGLDVPDAQVDESYNTVASRMGIDAQKLTQLLTAGGASDDTLKRRLRAQIAWTNLVRGRYKASLEIRKISNRKKKTNPRRRTNRKKNSSSLARLLLPLQAPTNNKANSLHPRQENGEVKNRQARAKEKMKPPHHLQERVKGKIRHLPRLRANLRKRNLRVT